ncbi:MAG TPA: ribosome rescue GTPase HflX [Arenicellales bacterium]|nr:ribosome rescue GTPase HflX [Arenicellales bacterium]
MSVTGPAAVPAERTLLVQQRSRAEEHSDSLEELALLARSAGADVRDRITGVRRTPDPATFIGSGKLEELRQCVEAHRGELVVFDHALSPVQERNLEKALRCRVLDRTGLILDIFAQRAETSEGKLQVELAQLRHLSTRLVRGWTHLERQKGGIGLRGPGETQLETDRRLIGQRIKHLKKRLERVSAQRELRRKSRRKVPIPTVCLVGYTNAGKSSLFNRLTGESLYAEDLLFATLDPTMRKLVLPNGREIVLSDTVGFIRHLPHSLVRAFHSTLEEVSSASLLLHVVDSAAEDRDERIEHVERVLDEIGAADVPRLLVHNKIDLSPGVAARVETREDGEAVAAWLSAHTGEGVAGLADLLQSQVFRDTRQERVRVPPEAGRVRAFLYDHAVILSEEVDERGGWLLEVDIEAAQWGRLGRLDEFGRCRVMADAASRPV